VLDVVDIVLAVLDVVDIVLAVLDVVDIVLAVLDVVDIVLAVLDVVDIVLTVLDVVDIVLAVLDVVDTVVVVVVVIIRSGINLYLCELSGRITNLFCALSIQEVTNKSVGIDQTVPKAKSSTHKSPDFSGA